MANRIRSGDTRQVGEHHERVVERIEFGVGTEQRRRPIGMDGTEYMLVGQEVIKAQVFDGSGKLANCGGIAVKLDLGVRDTNIHGSQPLMGDSPVPPHLPVAAGRTADCSTFHQRRGQLAVGLQRERLRGASTWTQTWLAPASRC